MSPESMTESASSRDRGGASVCGHGRGGPLGLRAHRRPWLETGSSPPPTGGASLGVLSPPMPQRDEGCQGIPKGVSSAPEPRPAGAAALGPCWLPQRPLSSCAPTPGPAGVPQASCGRSGPRRPYSEEGSPEGPGCGEEPAQPCPWRPAPLTAPACPQGAVSQPDRAAAQPARVSEAGGDVSLRQGPKVGLAGMLAFCPGLGTQRGRDRQHLWVMAPELEPKRAAGRSSGVGQHEMWQWSGLDRERLRACRGPRLSFPTNAHTHAHTRVQEGTWAAGSTRTEPHHGLSELLFPQCGSHRPPCLCPGAGQGESCCPEAQGPPPTQTPVCWALLLEEGLEGPQGEVGGAGSQAPGNPGNSLPWSHRDGL